VTPRYSLSRQARSDLSGIFRYTVSQWGEAQSARYLRLIWKVIETVAERPDRGRDCSELHKGYFCRAAGSHMIFYSKGRNRVNIIRILHQHMDYERHL